MVRRKQQHGSLQDSERKTMVTLRQRKRSFFCDEESMMRMKTKDGAADLLAQANMMR